MTADILPVSAASGVLPLPTDLPSHGAGFLPPVTSEHEIRSAAQKWLSSFERAAVTGDGQLAASLFAKNGFWRDILAFTNDFRSIRTPNIAAAGRNVFPVTQARDFVFAEGTSPELQSPFPDVTFLSVHFAFETRVGPAYGIANLVWEEGQWSAFTVFTVLDGVSGVSQRTGANRPRGEHNTPLCYDDTRSLETEFADHDPEVLISEFSS